MSLVVIKIVFSTEQQENHTVTRLMSLLDCALYCYDLKLKRLSNRTTLVLSNTRKLNRVPSTK